ncbi:MAG: PaaI family thioesterase [Alphaproteobacteria bacterium]|jgi:uncharacterized protein (TIGR00369 family)|nr:PaaI family thioesterase [Alphaproteobacteria bacterium]MDP6829635.1 PaaI family thioesterase [Alphaproteobacteria bacterium]MDP6874771.1 PaaI family thioesterase [Alphaproteobacteria bacterium]
MADIERQRHYSWHDPSAHWSRLGELSGLDYLSAVLRGEVEPPPVAVAMRLALVEVSKGRVVYSGQPGEDFANDVGSVQGGWLAALIDAAIGSAVHSALPAGPRYTTLELKVNYVRAVAVDSGEIRCIAEALHLGRSTATAQARAVDADGKLYAHATTTCLILPPE